MADSPEPSAPNEPSESAPNIEQQNAFPNAIDSGDFKRKSVRGGAATMAGQGVSTGLQIVLTVVLAHILSPTDYGLQGMVLTLTAFFNQFKDAGLSAAAVQRETLTKDQISTLFWINLGLGAILTLVVAALSPLLAKFYRDPRLLWLTVASASIFLINSLSVQHKALLDRDMRFVTGVKIDIFSAVIGAAVAIGMAIAGCGYWSLIGQNIAVPLVATIGTWIAMPWMPGRPRWTAEIRAMLRFGGTVSLNSFVVYIAYNSEKVLLGRFWGAAPLGLYSRAYQLANLPVQQLLSAVGAVAFPSLSRLQSDAQRMRRTYLRAHSFVVSLTVPVVISCGLFSDGIVRVLLGPKWAGTALILKLLSPTVMVFALINPLSWFLRATGRVARSLKIALFITPVVILGVVAGLRYGPPGVALGYSVAMVLLSVPLVAWAKHGTGITNADFWDAIKRPLLAGASGGFAGWLIQFFFQSSVSPTPLLALELTTSFTVYGALLLFAMGQREMYLDLLTHLFNRNQALPAKT